MRLIGENPASHGLALEFGPVSATALVDGVVAALLYFAVGVSVLVIGFLALDALTPGDLREQVYTLRHPSAAVLLVANHVALAGVVVTAIATSSQGLGQGLLSSAVFGLLGVVLQGASLRLLDLVVPGQLRAIVTEPELSGAAWAAAASMLAIGAGTAVALS